MTVRRLEEEMTYEELLLWNAHLQLGYEEQQAAERKAMSNRRRR